MNNFIRHNLVGNDASHRAVGLTRGVVAAGLTGLVNAVLILIPIADGQKLEFLAALNPVVILLSYVLYGQLDHMVKGGGNER